MRRIVILIGVVIAFTVAACEAHWNPFTPVEYDCVSWRSLHPVDTVRVGQSAMVASHPDSVCTLKH